MKGIRIGVSTQTPLVRPATGALGEARVPKPAPARSAMAGQALLVQQPDGAPLIINPGGVSRMVLQSLRRWHADGWIREAHWFSLQPAGPRHARLADPAVDLHHLSLPPEELAAYARTKEKLWADIHGLESPPFGAEDFRFYTRYNWFTSDAILEQAPGLDVAYVHDFQLLQVGALVGLAAPTVLRWHVPFEPRRIPRYTRNFLVRLMEDYDQVIVSTRRDLEGLLNAGFRGKASQAYPHVDPSEWPDPSAADVDAFDEMTGAMPGDPVVLCVARMDPMKRQDLLIAAFARLRSRHPRARLVLIGNGSFSGTKGAGLGVRKSALWRDSLERQARDLRVDDRVSFLGWQPDSIVAAAYARCDVAVLPSDLEGFGLTALEAWRYGKPCVLSHGAGAAEVVQDGLTGRLFASGDAEALAEALEGLLAHREARERMGESGRLALQNFDARTGAQRESAILEEAMERFNRV